MRVTARIRFPRKYGNPCEFDYRAWLMRHAINATMFVAKSKASDKSAIAIIGHRDVFPGSQIERVRERIGAFIDANLGYSKAPRCAC